MAERYFQVRNTSGAFIDNLFYQEGEVVTLDLKKGEKGPLWGIEVDADGNPIGGDNTGVVQDKLSDALANKIAGGSSGKKDDDDGKGSKDVGLTDTQKEQVKSALELLDHDNKEHWTARGLPNTETVSGLVGFAVERKDINEIAPEFVRKEPENK